MHLSPVVRKLTADWPEIKRPRVTELLRANYSFTGSVEIR
jgi:hypothetical protein